MKKGITVIAAIGAVLAITSGAFAADHYLISSSSQVKNGAISFSISRTTRAVLKGHKGQGRNRRDRCHQPGAHADAPAPEYGVGAVWVTPAPRVAVGVGEVLHPARLPGRRHDRRRLPVHLLRRPGALQGRAAGGGALRRTRRGYKVYPRIMVQRAGDPDAGSASQLTASTATAASRR